MKTLLIGGGEVSLLQSIVKAVEAKTGEKVEVVITHAKEAQFFDTKIKSIPISEPKFNCMPELSGKELRRERRLKQRKNLKRK